MSDIVRIGDATLIHGDCRDFLPTLDKFDLLLTDPPYGIGFAAQPTKWQRRAGQLAETWDDAPVDLGAFLSLASTQFVWGGNYYALPPSRGWLIWYKPDAPPSMASAEMCWSNRNCNARAILCSIRETNEERVGHPTQKPLKVIRFTLDQAPTAKTVLDPFMGSGTTGVACAQSGRSFTGIERERKYFDVACERISRAYAQGKLFADAPAAKPEQADILEAA